MKGIYKKISVGVLVAGLLVGGSGALQVGQAFADSNHKAVFGGDFDGLWAYSYIEDLKNEYGYKYEIESISKDAHSKIEGELEDGIDWMFLLRNGNRKNVSIKDIREGEKRAFKVGNYYYYIRFIKVK